MGIFYRTRETGQDYEFDFVRLPHTWQINILQQPSYAGRDTSASIIHRLGGPGNYFICWSTAIPSLGQAKTIAANWAEGTDRYIRTGNASGAFSQAIFTDFGEDRRAELTFRRLESGEPRPVSARETPAPPPLPARRPAERTPILRRIFG